MIDVIPAVDVLGGEAVRLRQGDYDDVTLRRGDPALVVAELAAAGAPLVHVVDLDGARSGRLSPGLFTRLAEAAGPARIQASGGVRSVADAEALLAAGAARVLVGTAALTEPGPAAFAEALGDRLVVALDVRGGEVVVRGWTRGSGETAEAASERCARAGVARLHCTAVERDGTLAGPDTGLLRRVVAASGLPVVAAGGIASEAHLAAVEAAGCEAAVVGRALLDGTLTLRAWRAPTAAVARASRSSVRAWPNSSASGSC
jgi:phosphoribosylformimino-5-aminoimidazole carboxamide ribotide isomerase